MPEWRKLGRMDHFWEAYGRGDSMSEWTRELPTKEGYYWIRGDWSYKGRLLIVQVWTDGGRLWVNMFGDEVPEPIELFRSLWWLPIPEPSAPKEMIQ